MEVGWETAGGLRSEGISSSDREIGNKERREGAPAVSLRL